MITEFILAAAGTYVWNYWNTTDERKIKNAFKEIMLKSGIKNKDDETFKIYKIIKTSYGYIAYINNVKGLSLEHINTKLNVLEDNLNGIITVEKDRFKDYIKMCMVDKDISEFKFEPIRCTNYQLLIGKDFKGGNYLIDVNKDAHILIGGATGTGKSFLLAGILANLIYNSSKTIDLYLLQICKSELSAFENCNCVKKVAYDLEDCSNILYMLINEMDKRSELFKQHGIRNITQWNMHFKNKYMKRVYIVIEEISFFLETDVWNDVMKIAKAGRSVGLHLISCVQRSTATNIPPDLKSQMTRITFRQKSSIDSTNIINTPDATKLKQMECIIDGNSDYIQVKTAWIDEDYVLLNKYVSEIKIPSNKEKQEILNVKKINKKIYSIEQPKVIDIEENEITTLGTKGFIESSKKKNKTGTISWEDFKNANRKG